MNRWSAVVAFLAALHQAMAADAPQALHVPSPDWRDQVIYLAMIDRFDDGEPGNNDQGAGEYDPTDPSRFSGGDLAGALRRLDYLQGLGVTALWLTPPVANQWWDPKVGYGGYHGYWATDFTRIDAHFGTLEDYRRLSRGLHARGMYLVHDVVVNHVGNFIHCTAPGKCTTSGAPAQAPFSDNAPGAPSYHWNPRIADFESREQQFTWQLADLDDLATENTAVRDALRASYAHWIREAGVDAFRIDTAFYVPPDFFEDFLHGAPNGIVATAKATGRVDFLAFGEGFALDRPFEDTQARRIDEYMQGERRLPSMINFPLQGSLLDVFARGRPPSVLAHRVGSMMTLHRDPHRMPTFVDNHDVDRFLAVGSEAALKQALLALFTLPGIPTIYQGTEQGFTAQRAAMFAGGHGSGGRDRFDTAAPLYRYLAALAALRRAHPAFSRGTPEVFEANGAAPGALGFSTTHAGETTVVLFNTSDSPTLVAGARTGLAASLLEPLFAIDGEAPPGRIERDGSLTMVLPPRSGYAWRTEGALDLARRDAGTLSLAALPARVAGDLRVEGKSDRALQLVVDGDLHRARAVTPGADGRFTARVSTEALVDPAVEHVLVARHPDTGRVSAPQRFRVERAWRLAGERDDPRGDDHGRSGKLVYPTDPAFAQRRPLDLLGARAWTSGSSLRVEVRMRDVFTGWNAPNGFDHLALVAFVALPGRDGGARVMPQQQGELPGGLRWHYRVRLGGWANALFASEGASATEEGRHVAPAPSLAVDAARDTITFTIPADALGSPSSLAGATVHLATWDYDGRFRPLAREATAFGFGGPPDALALDEMTLAVR